MFINFINARRCLPFLAALLCAAAVSAQPSPPAPTQPSSNGMVLDVVVTAKSGTPVTGLRQQDFTVLDNKAPQTITSFQAVDGRQAPIEVIVLVDAVNIGYDRVAYARGQIDKFLRADGGHLAHPTTLAVLTDTGSQIKQGFSTDGNALSASLDQYTVSLRNVRRRDGFWGAAEIFQISLEGLHELVTREASVPGRKIVLWVSPGWPLLSGPYMELDDKQQRQFFGDIVDFSTQLRRARITLDTVDPLGTADSIYRAFYWKDFVKGISKPSQVQLGNLGLQVIAAQSGGLVLNSNNDTASLLQRCLSDTASYYELAFDAPSARKADEYHALEIRIDKPGLTARTRQGYYSQP
jgi:VWFA-related protein